MIRRKMIVSGGNGLYLMSNAHRFAAKMKLFESNVTLLFKDRKLDGKSFLNIISACIGYGAEMEIECDGSDEQEAMKAAVDLLETEQI